VLRLFSNPVRFNGRLVLVGDGIKIPKSGKKMPGVKLLHQQSNCSTKPEYIMGHSLQAVALLVYAASTCFAVPLTMRIHEGLCGPIVINALCSTKCWTCSRSWQLLTRSILWRMPTTRRERS
jgi:hypothetical protein